MNPFLQSIEYHQKISFKHRINTILIRLLVLLTFGLFWIVYYLPYHVYLNDKPERKKYSQLRALKGESFIFTDDNHPIRVMNCQIKIGWNLVRYW